MLCSPVPWDNPRILAGGLSLAQINRSWYTIFVRLYKRQTTSFSIIEYHSLPVWTRRQSKRFGINYLPQSCPNHNEFSVDLAHYDTCHAMFAFSSKGGIMLTLKEPVKTAADNIHRYFFIDFQRRLDVSRGFTRKIKPYFLLKIKVKH